MLQPENNLTDPGVIRIRGARTHNLQNISVDIPTGRLVVVSGVSGSGKSTLAFDTLFAESQRRYLECISVRTRSLLHQLPRADVDDITGLAPAVSVDQRVSGVPQRSTLSTVTEIHDYLRLLYARAGTAHCTRCGRPVQQQSIDQILQRVLQHPERTRLMVLSPIVRGRRGAHQEVLDRIVRNGFVRARINGEMVDVADFKPLQPSIAHNIEAVVDRIVIREGVAQRLRESLKLACRESDGTCIVCHEANGQWHETLFSTRYACPDCDLSFPTPDPGTFSFHSPRGACGVCGGLGIRGTAVPSQSVADQPTAAKRCSRNAKDQQPLPDAAVPVFRRRPCEECGGSRLQPFPRSVRFLDMTLPEFTRQEAAAAAEICGGWLKQLEQPGQLSHEAQLAAARTLPDLHTRLRCLVDVGVGYLTLDRPANTLSGGEYQRARLAAALSTRLHGAHYVLDEPTAGLHPRDTAKLLNALRQLRDSGGTVIVVEHDPQVIEAADWVLDMGPGAGADGGQLLFAGTPAALCEHSTSPTGQLLRERRDRRAEQPAAAPVSRSSRRRKSVPEAGADAGANAGMMSRETAAAVVHPRHPAPPGADGWLRIRGARLHNLRQITAEIPLRRLTGISGVSGSGKSSLIRGTLVPWLQAVLAGRDAGVAAADCDCNGISGAESIARLVCLDQAPPGRSGRSCIATLTPLWDDIRRLLAKTREARARGWGAQFFSFNTGGGRCSACRGTGIRAVRMPFLANAEVICSACGGTRFSRAARSVRFRGKSVDELLRLRVDEAREFFGEFARLRSILEVCCSVGLGYLQLGQSSSTFSGGENQRARIAAELALPSAEHTLYVLDEPTGGLHAFDVQRLIGHLRGLVRLQHTVIVLEHHSDVLNACDWVLELGPDAAAAGGQIISAGCWG
ncbi:MAG: Excinuclease subunit [Planctomycetota bacterium]